MKDDNDSFVVEGCEIYSLASLEVFYIQTVQT